MATSFVYWPRHLCDAPSGFLVGWSLREFNVCVSCVVHHLPVCPSKFIPYSSHTPCILWYENKISEKIMCFMIDYELFSWSNWKRSCSTLKETWRLLTFATLVVHHSLFLVNGAMISKVLMQLFPLKRRFLRAYQMQTYGSDVIWINPVECLD
jgi:hypothetical protein